MSQLARQLITDLLSDEHEMLHNGEIAPYGISIFFDPEANKQVREAASRIEDAAIKSMDPDSVYQEQRRHIGFLDSGSIMLTPSTLVLVLFYQGASQRVLELNLNEKGAKLHFRK